MAWQQVMGSWRGVGGPKKGGIRAKKPGDTSKREPEKEQNMGSPGLEKGRGAIRA